MNNQSAKPATRHALLALAFLLALATPVFAQQAPGPPADRTNPERERQHDMSRREWQLRNFGTAPEGTTENRKLEALMAQIEQDFNRILTMHNQIVRATSADQALDYGFVSDATAEIRKRASRLQSTLGLRDPESSQENSEQSSSYDKTQLKEALFALCRQIKSFVTNPVIENPGIVNAKELARARRDLEGVINLSGNIKNAAERLKKSAK